MTTTLHCGQFRALKYLPFQGKRFFKPDWAKSVSLKTKDWNWSASIHDKELLADEYPLTISFSQFGHFMILSVK
jgi:hypothetical protein